MGWMNRREFVSAGAAALGLVVIGVDPAAAAPGMGGTIDVGTLADYPSDAISDKFLKQHKILVARSGDQIFAMTSKCTHKGCDLNLKDSAIKCKCHGSAFSNYGTPTAGPAKVALSRYAIKLSDDKHIIVDKSKQFQERQWTDPASFVKVG